MYPLRFARPVLVLLLVIFSSAGLLAQVSPVNGKVKDQNGTPVEGATVAIKGSHQSTMTNDEGEFTINVASKNAVLVISYVGMVRQEVKLAGRTNVTVTMSKSETTMDDVVVIGYGSQKAGDITGSIVSVDLDKMEDMPVATVTEALAGQVPGLHVSGGSSRPGVNPTLSIRQQFGWGKDGSSELPLIVIDDVIQLDPNTGLPSLDQFNLLDLSEIESITVLRDASAAIYGSRASQGAIVVKTKRGKNAPPKISYSGKFQQNDAVSHVKTMSAYEYGIFANRFGRASAWDASHFYDEEELEKMKSINYDWRKEAWSKAYNMQHSVNVSGGTDRATYFAGASYYRQGDNMADQDYNKWSFRTGTDVKVVNNLKLSATVAGNNFDLQKSFTKVSINDGSYGRGSEQTDYSVLNHMPKYIPWIYNVDGEEHYVSPALGPHRVQKSPAGQNNISGWNYFALMNNGSNTNTHTFSYNANFALQYDIPFIQGLSVRATYATGNSTENTEQVMMPQLLSAAQNTEAAGTHLYGPDTKWDTKLNTRGARVSYADIIGKLQQSNFFVNYDRSFGLHNVSAVGSIERSRQDYHKKYIIYENPLVGGYNGASPSAGELNASNTYVNRTESGSLSYLGRVSYNYNSKYLFQFLFREDASTKFAPENYWGFFPSVSAGWVISREDWFRDKVNWIDNLKIRVSIGKTGNDNLKPWRWMQLYGYAADKGMGFGDDGGELVAGVAPDANPNRDVKWDRTLKQNIGLDFSVLQNRLSGSIDAYYDKIRDMLTQMNGVGVPISIGGAFAEQNYASVNTWGTEISINWRDKVGQVDYSIGMNYGWGNNKVIKYFPVAFNYPSYNNRQVGASTIFPAWGFATWKGTSGGDGLLRTDADIDAYWQYLTDLATHAGGTPSYLGNTDKSALQKGMLAYEDQAGELNAIDKTIAGKDGRIEEDQDYVKLAKKNLTHTINTSLHLAWKSLSFSAQLATSWGGFNRIDFIKQSTSSGQMFWAHESYLTDMYDPVDNVDGKYPSLGYYDENSSPSDFWQVSSFRCYVRSLSIGYTLPRELVRKARIDNARLFLSGYNLWDFYNPYPDKYRNMYDDPTVNYPTLRTWSLGVNVSF